MADSPWDAFTNLAGVARAAPWFDEEERDYKLELAPRLRSVLEVARDGDDWVAALKRARRSPYNLTNQYQNRWLLDWAETSEGLPAVIGAFLDQDESAVERFDRLAQLAETEGVAKGQGASILAFGSIFNFAASPKTLPIVRAQVFETTERRTGWDDAAGSAPTKRYEHHLAFADEARQRMLAAGVPIRDMVDVQGVIYVVSGTASRQLRKLAEAGHEATVRAFVRGFYLESSGTFNEAETADSRGVTRESVLQAIDEYRTLGGDAFRSKYGYGPALRYHLVDQGELFDSKAIYGVAYGHAHPDEGPLANSDFTGGAISVVKPLRDLGFEITGDPAEKPSEEEPVQGDLPRLWWVNQGSSFKRARAGSYLWAPKVDKSGRPQSHWEALTEARQGDLVLNYASGSIRGVSRVEAVAVDSARPDPVADSQWNEDGWLVQIAYHDLAEPVPLRDIPEAWRRAEDGPFTVTGGARQGYFFPISPLLAGRLASRYPQLGLSTSPEPPAPAYEEPTFEEIVAHLEEANMSLEPRLLRRYHLSLKTRGFVILSGISGTGKTWLAELYAQAVEANHLLVAVAPNWTTNEDLLGYLNPLTDEYHHTEFSQFLREASEAYESATREGRSARPFHLTLDEMNLARVEYYFARFLSAMEVRSRDGTATIELATGHQVLLTPNLMFTGTVNIDETTHGFADKVYDRAQLLELVIPPDDLRAHIEDTPYVSQVMAIWNAVEPVAPFAFRVLDEIRSYVDAAQTLGVPWTEALDEQLLQKVLPKLKGADVRLEQALKDFIDASDDFPLSRTKAESMLDDFTQHGFASFF